MKTHRTTRYRLTFTIALLGCGLLVPAAAQETTPSAPLSLQDCISTALENQTDVLVGQQSVTSAEARTTQAKSGYYPQIAIQSLPLSISGGDRRTSTQGTAITVNQTLYDGGLRDTQVQGAKAGVVQNTAALERTRQTVIFSTTRAYFDALRAQQLATVADARVKYIEGQQALVQARVQAGEAAAADAAPVEAQLANARVEQLAAKNAVRTALIQLQNTMGLSPNNTFAIQEVAQTPEIALRPLEEYQAAAVQHRPDVRQFAAGEQAAQADVKSAKINLQPRIVASGQSDIPIGGTRSSSWGITGGVVYDIFNGRENRAVYTQAKAGLTSAQLRSAQLHKDMTAQVQEAYVNVTNATERLAASAVSVQAAQKNFDVQQARYREGLAIPLDLLNAQVDVTTAQSNAVQAKYDYLIAVAQLEYATGTPGGLYAQ